MMLHKQKSLYEISSKEKTDLADMILVAINEVTKFDPEKADGDRYKEGVDFSNIPPFNPHMISWVLYDLGYEEGELDTNGWELDYWLMFKHPDDKTFPPMQMSGTAWIHKCQLHGDEEDERLYPHLEDNPEYADRIKHGLELISKVMDRGE